MAQQTYQSGANYDTVDLDDIKELDEVFAGNVEDAQEKLETYVGYPRNWLQHPYIIEMMKKVVGIPFHNTGDPETGSNFGPHAIEAEAQVLDFFRELLKCERDDSHYAYLDSNGSKAIGQMNLFARDYLRAKNPGKKIVAFVPACAHYSSKDGAEAADVTVVALAHDNGVVAPEEYAKACNQYPDYAKIAWIVCGGTVHEGSGDIPAILQTHRGQRHEIVWLVDAAYTGVSYNLLDAMPFEKKPNFLHDVDGIMTSVHKFIGTTAPLGLAMVRREIADYTGQFVQYINSRSKAGGSRDAKSILEAWVYIMFLKNDVFRKWAEACVEKAIWAKDQLENAGYKDVLLHEMATTVYFPQPSKKIMEKYALAPENGFCHLIVTPHTLHPDDLGTNALGEKFQGYDSLRKAVEAIVADKRA